MILIALTFGILAVNALAFGHARALLQFSASGTRTKNPEDLSLRERAWVLLTGTTVPKPADAHTPASLGLSFEQRTIDVGNGIRLGAWWIPQAQAEHGVILFHGFAASKGQVLDEAAAFHARGLSVLVVDFRGSGESSESYTTIGYVEADDVIAAVRYAENELGLHRPLLYGFSMGAAAVLRACALGLPQVRGVIIQGVFDRMLSTVEQRFVSMGVPATPFAQLLVLWGGVQGGFWGFSHNPADYARSCRAPVLMLHGSDDPRATLAQATHVFEAVPGDKQLVVFPQAGHEPLRAHDRARWDEAVDAWLRDHP